MGTGVMKGRPDMIEGGYSPPLFRSIPAEERLLRHNRPMIPAFLATMLAAGPEAGPAIGQAVPTFELPDQGGRVQSFASLRGPRGLVLVFFRSADW